MKILKEYPSYKDSGVEWLGDVPEEWTIKRLKTVLSRNDGGVWGEDFDDDGIIVLRSTEQTIDGEWCIEEPARRLLNHSEYAASRLRCGDLVVTKSSGSALHIGKTTIVTQEIEELNCCYSNFMQRLRVKSQNLPRFLYYIINGPIGRAQFVYGSNTTTGLANLNGEVIGNVIIALPSVSEQQAIADFLDRRTSAIDELIAKKERVIELLKEKRTAIISHAVTKGLNPDVKMKDSGVDWLGDVPEHWEVIKLKYLTAIKYGLGQPPKEMDGGLPLLRATNVERGKINTKGLVYVDPTDIPYERDPVLKTNDIIVVRSGAYTGDSAIIPPEFDGAITGYDMVVRTKAANPMFVAYSLLGIVVQSQINLCRLRAAQPHLNAEELGGCLLVVPSTETQKQIADFLDRETSKIDALIAKVTEAIEKLKEYRTALISAAVTGKIDVREEGGKQ